MADPGEIYRLTHGATDSTGVLKYFGVDWQWFQDTTNNYSGVTQLIYIINQLQNAQSQAVWPRGFLAIPYVGSMSGLSTAIAGALTLKSGFWHIVDSYTIQFCGVSINNLCRLTNMGLQIRTLLDSDPLRLSQSLPQRGFFFDTPETNTYVSLGATGAFFANNKVATNTFTPGAGWSSYFPVSNQGLLQRIKTNNFQPDGTVMTASDAGTLHMQTSWFNSSTQYVSGVALINLYDLCDFFSERNLGFPLKNGQMTLNLNVNQGQITYNNNGSCSASTFPFNTCPLQVTDVGTTNMSSNTSTITFAIGQYGTSGAGGSTFPTRLYLPLVKLDPSVDLRLSTSLFKKINFRDFQQFQSSPYAARQNINWNISNSIPGLKRLFVLPLLSQTVQPANIPSYGNVTSSCPGMFDTNLLLGNIALTLSGSNLTQNNLLYNYEQWLFGTEPQTLNGGACPYTAGSLINQTTWQRGYGVYVFDCSRTTNLQKVEPNSPISATLIATNQSGVSIDLIAWAEVEVGIDLSQTPLATYAG